MRAQTSVQRALLSAVFLLSLLLLPLGPRHLVKMARNTNGKPVKSYPSARKANATGYAKRHALKAKGGALSDVYEHQQQRVRRDKVKLDLDREEEADRGFAGSDDDGFDRDALRARLIGENVDDEMIDSEDDEELDSDAAFESGDEEQYAGFSFGKKVCGASYHKLYA